MSAIGLVVDHACFSSPGLFFVMEAAGGGRQGQGQGSNPPLNVTDLLQRLNLTEEGAIADFSDDEEISEDLVLKGHLSHGGPCKHRSSRDEACVATRQV